MKLQTGLIIVFVALGLLSGCTASRATPDVTSVQPSQQDIQQEKLQQSLKS